MFLGHYSIQLKSSNRLHLPTEWRKLISGGIYLTRGFDQNLLILKADAFKEVYTRISSLNIADPLARLLLRMFLGTASYEEIDENESIPVSPILMNYADLKDQIVIIGQGEYLEVWSPILWDQQKIQIQDAQANGQRFSSFIISAS
ncbi:MAG: hypothetical protein Q8L41_04425 [Anaerolineales bacterium]|nr:hypothetical protein [Anaerolineales bacterium]